MKAKKKKEKKTLGVEQLGFEFQVRSDISPEEESQNKVYECNHLADIIIFQCNFDQF